MKFWPAITHTALLALMPACSPEDSTPASCTDANSDADTGLDSNSGSCCHGRSCCTGPDDYVQVDEHSDPTSIHA